MLCSTTNCDSCSMCRSRLYRSQILLALKNFPFAFCQRQKMKSGTAKTRNIFFAFFTRQNLEWLWEKSSRPWWPSGLEHVSSNSSRHSLKDPGSNPRSGLRYWSLRVRNGLSLFKKWSRLWRSIELYLEWGNPVDKATQINPDSWPRSAPTLKIHSRAASSVGVTSPFQRSQHMKQFRRKADKKMGEE